MKRLFTFFLSALIAFGVILTVPVSAFETPTITVSNTEGTVEEEITLAVGLESNPGVIAVGIQIEYDSSVLELKGAAGKDFAGVDFGPLTDQKLNITWEDALNQNNTNDGVLAELTFLIKNGSETGDYDVSVSYDEENIFNSGYTNVYFDVKSGKVTVLCPHKNKTHIEAKASTCAQNGWDDYYSCDFCGQLFDKTGEKLTEIPYLELSTLGHNYDEGVVTKAPSCTDKGVKTYTCKNDSSHTYTEDIPALGHNYDSGKITKDPSTTNTGIITFTCLNDSTHTYVETIPKLKSAPVPSNKEADSAPVNKAINKPSNIKTVCNTNKKQMTISFKAVYGASNYRIAYRKAGAKKWSLNWTKGKTTYILKKLNSKSLYEFKFAAYKVKNGKWERGNWSNVSYRYFFKLTQKPPKAAKKAIKVLWQKDKNCKGYYVLYSLKKSMSGQKKITVNNKNKTSYTIKKLKKGKKYYIRIRAYKVKDGKTYIGELSAIKSVKVK